VPNLKYFAYGSNMCSGRLRDRVSCTFVAVAKLVGYQLHFHKVSKDGSSKCDAFHTGSESDIVWGVLFDIPAAEKTELDRYEGRGKGYDDTQVVVERADGAQMQAYTYVAATDSIKELPPYTWYKAFVEAGAQEHRLPQEYVTHAIRAVDAVQDSDRGRHERETGRLEALKKRQESVGN
jgi:cation transport regulator ChaC